VPCQPVNRLTLVPIRRRQARVVEWPDQPHGELSEDAEDAMDISLSEEQELLQGSARDFLQQECPIRLVRAMEDDAQGYDLPLWKQMGDLGWLGLVLPEEYGGTGGTMMDLVVLLEEFGRALVPGPFIPTVIQVGLPIVWAGSDQQKRDYLPKLIQGELIGTMAWHEPSATSAPWGIEAMATAQGEGYVLNGTKLYVPYAHVADYLLTVARTGGGGTPADGITLFLVDAKSPGVTITKLRTIADDHQCEVVLKDVRVPHRQVLGEVGKGWPLVERIRGYGAVAKCAEMVGIAQQAFEISLNYAKTRVQFGRPIGSFQVIKHKLANMVIDVDGSRYVTYRAAWLLSEGLPAGQEIAVAKAWTNEACRRVVREAQQVHGGIGYTKEYDLQLYTRRAKAAEIVFDGSDTHREAVATSLDL
jgi:alkylation response protein AidB-like acyl-CoA dehydrogenase